LVFFDLIMTFDLFEEVYVVQTLFVPVSDPEPKKPEPKPEPPSNDLDLDRLSALVDKAKEDERRAGPQASQEGPERPAVGEGDRLSASDVAKMQAKVAGCWNASAVVGAPRPEDLVVVVQFELNRDGTLQGSPRVANALEINLSGNRFWKAAERTAVNAVLSCQPYDFLDPGRYDDWQEIELNFDPSVMAGF
ncbi:MAG: hypothetical protein ACFB00_08655, partial [Parvularculaceae bacterium]